MTAVTRAEERSVRQHKAELERMLANPIAEPGLRDRIRTEYLTLTQLENAHVEHRA